MILFQFSHIRRMEEQLKLVRLQDEMESQRQTRQREKSRINLDLQRPTISQQPTKPPTTVRSEPIIEANLHAYPPNERLAQTDRGKENWDAIKRNDKGIYNFFTNSAPNHQTQLKDLRFSHYFDLEDVSENEVMSNSMCSSYNTYPSKSTRHNDAVQRRHDIDTKRPMCNFCRHNRLFNRNQKENLDYICGACENEPICLNCRKEICVQCKRPTQNNENTLKVPPRHLKQRNNDEKIIIVKKSEPQAKPKYVRLDSFQPIYTDEDDSLSDLSISDHKPYSFNIDESSVFHPSKSRISRKLSVSVKNGEVFVESPDFDEFRRITEEKLKKFAKNYGELRTKKTTEKVEQDTRIPVPVAMPRSKQTLVDRLPAMRENTKKLIEFAKELERGDDNIFRRIEAKHQASSNISNWISE